MKRKLGKKNHKLFLLFSFLVLVILLLFSYAVYTTFSYDREVYSVAQGSFLYDSDNHYISLEEEASLKQQWNQRYRLSYTVNKEKKSSDLGEDVVIYHENDYKLYVYGSFFEVKTNGDILYHEKKTEIARNSFPGLYKLADRKYLLVGRSIETKNKEISTSHYLIVTIDKSGNAMLLNHELNSKTLATLILETSDFSFDVANERMVIGEEIIDLKKISGSSNQYVAEKKEEKVEEEKKETSTNSSSTDGGNSSNQGNVQYGASGGSSPSAKPEKLNILKSVQVTSINTYTSYIDILYNVVDPKGEFVSIYIDIVGSDNYEEKVILNKTSNRYRLRNLTPNTEYTLTLSYTHKNANEDSILEETASTLKVKTARDRTKVAITKISGSKIYFNVSYDQSYAYQSSNVKIISDNTVVGTMAVNTEEALSTKGYNGMIDTKTALGYEIILQLEDCIYEGEAISSTIKTKYINK